MILLDKEQIETISNDKSLTLTNLRVQYHNKEWGKAKIVSILLENISSIEIAYKSNVTFIVFATIISILTIVEGSYLIYGLAISVIFVLLFLVSRRHYFIIYSKGGGKINLLVKGMKTKSILEFLNKVETNILNRN